MRNDSHGPFRISNGGTARLFKRGSNYSLAMFRAPSAPGADRRAVRRAVL
jgi:hypothetical protein